MDYFYRCKFISITRNNVTTVFSNELEYILTVVSRIRLRGSVYTDYSIHEYLINKQSTVGY